ncbi:CRP FNR family transcriptional regulator [Limosilactobacillus frumenti DSM 13145]|uniref:CRP FNR family transcriptional regulator n=1 Tax=Limosilactobacillus frumenti DSM 13145 TaxID=1423746 RepID=A0A0R1PAW3_9LACO|nr:CRP FNR family transcriptional regulator [Limosilactobacillus frumenti DSM 13145]MBA2913971.1 Crp/Fnr family transcriptional regulator [Limosilactobacillus frumenti]QFG71974.1 Crp/Fnr family transcriptional regulator [Limosilactobacillus frumenti]
MGDELCVQLVPLFNHLNITKQRQVERLVHHQHVQRGTVVASPDNSDRLVIIKQGQAQMYQLSISGEKQVQRILTTGDYVGETWLLGAENASSYVEMITASDICILYRTDFLRLINEQQDIALKIMMGQAARINSLRRQNQLLGLPNIEQRLTTYLQQLVLEQGKSTITLPLKLKDLSSYLGTTPETLSRKLAKLEQTGQIKRHLRQVQVLKKM